MNYLLDTNSFDYFLDNKVDLTLIKSKGHLYITNVQISEISNITNNERKLALTELTKQLNLNKLNLLSGIWIDDLLWDDEQNWIDDVNSECISLLGNSKKNLPWKDALIGEVALKNNFMLVTNDNGFANKAKVQGISVISVQDFLNI